MSTDNDNDGVVVLFPGAKPEDSHGADVELADPVVEGEVLT